MWIFFIVPTPFVLLTLFDNDILGNETFGNLTIGDPLTLDCTVTAVRGISSSVDIIWTTGGRVVRRVDNITADIENASAIYTDSFEISSLSANDNGREYQCTVVINASQSINVSDVITLSVAGEFYSCIITFDRDVPRFGRVFKSVKSPKVVIFNFFFIQSMPRIPSKHYVFIKHNIIALVSKFVYNDSYFIWVVVSIYHCQSL